MRKLLVIGFFIGGGLLATVQPAHPQLPVIDAAAIAKLVEEIAILGNQTACSSISITIRWCKPGWAVARGVAKLRSSCAAWRS